MFGRTRQGRSPSSQRRPATSNKFLRQARLELEHLERRIVPSVLDLSTTAGLSGTINGAIFTGATPSNTSASGVVNPIVRFDNDGIEQGLNTNYVPQILNNNNKGNTNFIKAVQLKDLPP